MRGYDYVVKELDLGRGVALRQAKTSDLPELLRVCLQTGDSGNDATHLHKLTDLVGDIYVAPYVLYEPEFAYALWAESAIVGYLLGVLNTNKFEMELVQTYWPQAKAKYAQVDSGITSSDQDLLNELAKQGFSDPKLLENYPSHLHIDIVASHQGAGYGKSMIAYLLAELKTAESKGVHLHMSSKNDRARAFYKKFGFTEVSENSEDCIMGLKF